MVVNVSVFDLQNFPDNPKTVTIDHLQVVPLGGGGDEKWVLSSSTIATASGSTTIQDIFIQDMKIGYSMSNGFDQGPFTVTGTQNTLQVSIDGSTLE